MLIDKPFPICTLADKETDEENAVNPQIIRADICLNNFIACKNLN